jgi:hypothetical protein
MFVDDKWKDVVLQKLKDELNTENKLDFYYLKDWHEHTRTMNKADEIQHKLYKKLDSNLVHIFMRIPYLSIWYSLLL